MATLRLDDRFRWLSATTTPETLGLKAILSAFVQRKNVRLGTERQNLLRLTVGCITTLCGINRNLDRVSSFVLTDSNLVARCRVIHCLFTIFTKGAG